jgi:cytochrome P450
MAVSVPVIDDVTLDQLYADPYPVYRRLRAEAPVAFVPAARIHLVTRFDDIIAIERDHETFPARDPRSLQIRAMGHTLMRKDGEDHRRERMVIEPSFRPGTVKAHWGPIFERIAHDLIDGFEEKGEADLFDAFAAPLAARCLMEVLGLTNVDWRDLVWWSQALMDAVGNYGDDPHVWARGKAASDAIDAALDERIAQLRQRPDPSVISSMVNDAEPLSLEQVRANVKVIVGGGLNEPRDATCTALYGLLANPDQLEAVRADPGLQRAVFEETVRWVAPIGMYPRTVARTVEIGGAVLEKGDAIGLSAASACHDEAHFENGHLFDVFRKRSPHLAFGSGPHFCLGTWVARKQVGEIAVPTILERLSGLRLDPDRPARFGGWVFRGPLSLPVKWNPGQHA